MQRKVPWRRNKRQRGVSPIIATILLVAITVVLAAVLYILISGLTGGSSSKPYTVGFGSPKVSSGAGTSYLVFSLSVTNDLNTGLFGLKIANPAGVGQASVATTGASCLPTTTGADQFTSCTGTAGGWYVLLTNANGGILATYSGTAAKWGYPAGISNVVLSNSDSIVVVSSTSMSGIGDRIAAFGTGSSSVSGSAEL
ncbi:MAG: archaellin/type IV pilin N-terminal domain-containing protein [Thermoplasmata archaeon]